MDKSIFTTYTVPPLATLDKNGDPQFVSQGFGLGTREHDDVMLAYGYSRFTRFEADIDTGDFVVIRLNIGDVGAHHAEARTLLTSEGSVRFLVYDVTGNENLFPASPSALQIVNDKGPVIETPGVDVVGEFFSYPIQTSNPFVSLTPIDNIPLYTTEGRGNQSDESGAFSSVKGRHYTPNRVYAAVIQRLGTGPTNLYYRYNWHEY